MNKGVTQEDTRCAATSNGLVEVEHGRCYFAIGSCHTLRRLRIDETILESQFADDIGFKKNRH
jgi:hypothetical protein